jgi:anthranilate synthase component 1
MRMTSFEQFRELAQRGTFVPVSKEIVADLLTPVSAFLKVAEHSDYAFLLESVEGGEHVGRYSFLGKDPFLIVRGRGGATIVERAGETTESEKPFMATLRELMAAYHAPFVPGLPRFTGGAVGYLGYDAAAWFEPVTLQPVTESDDEAGFMLFDTVLAFDHVRHRILIIANARITGEDDLESLYQFACARIAFVERELDRPLSKASLSPGAPIEVRSNVSRADFERMVRTAKEYIAAGDIYQVVLSQRFEAAVTADPFTVYRALRHVNPSPYMYFLRLGGRSIVGSSPEMLVRVEGRRLETHPIAGTRPRGATEEDDVRLAEELKRNEKERAEHVMLVDLGRNDIGRVAEYGSVRVPTYMALERYSHVMHLVSIVEGRLAEPHDRLDALVACFPAGTVSGAPKVRAMEIIAELENRRRGVYAGAVGYLDFAGNLDCCITIRTVVMEQGRAYVQAGAGIVADSNPAAEYEETCDKARGVVRALELAQAGLGAAWFSSSTITTRSPTTSCSISASSGPTCACGATMRSRSTRSTPWRRGRL